MRHHADATVRTSSVWAVYRKGLWRVGALRDVSLAAPAGSVTAIIGPNGAGKTTLIRVLLGFLSPRRGHVSVGSIAPRDYRRRYGVGYLPEEVALPAGWTVDALLREGVRLAGLRGDQAREALATAWTRTPFQPGDRRRVQQLSKGTRRQLAFAFALAGDPRLVLLDEPTSGLDAEARLRFRRTIRELGVGGATVVVCSHDLAEVERIAHTIVVIRQGRVIDTLESGSQADLEEVVVGRDLHGEVGR